MDSQCNIMDASISDLLQALSAGRLTSVGLTARYLRRLSIYDTSGPCLSAVPILNPHAMEEATASDTRRGAGFLPRLLEGIPFLVKDNIKVRGMTVAAGSPAFEHLVATEDAACVKALKDAGAVVLGRTNMPAMANGGMQRGLYGRAESPYNADYLTAAYGSGSSNGSATAVAAGFAAFALGTETVSSGRSPASNNALVAYTPSRSVLPLSGVWPLYPTCDVLVPYTKSMDDTLLVLDVLSRTDQDGPGDFWREQPFISLSTSQAIGSSFQGLKNDDALRGKRLGVPSMYIGGASPVLITTRPSILTLWEKAKQTLEARGATVVEVDFPLVTNYEACDQSTDEWAHINGMPSDWLNTERHELIAHAWDDFLSTNGQPDCRSLGSVNPDEIFPLAPGSLPGEAEADNQMDWAELVQYPLKKTPSMFALPGMEEGLNALEKARKRTLEDWMAKLGLDAVVFPANGDVGPANADADVEASRVAWSNGVLYSNGNLAIRHLGVPTVSVPMGIMEDTGMPVNITFAGGACQDRQLLELGYAFEAASRCRQNPQRAPVLDSDFLSNKDGHERATGQTPSIELTARSKEINGCTVHIQLQGMLTDPTKPLTPEDLTCYIDGEYHSPNVEGQNWEINLCRPVSSREEPWPRWTSPALVQTVVIVVYRGVAGEMIIL